MNRRFGFAVGVGVLALAAIGVGIAYGTTSDSTPVGPYGSSMMGGNWSSGSTNTSTAPGWMMGGNLPGSIMGGGMMGSATDPGKVMGSAWANAPGWRVSASQATAAGDNVPTGATVDRAANRITFTGSSVHLVAVASPSGGPDETYRIAGMVNPTIRVPAEAQVHVEVINADPDTAHGMVVTSSTAASSWMPMMNAAAAFAGSAVWFLGDPTAAGMHLATMSFTAGVPGTYAYLCAVPGHAQRGMVGSFVVA